MDIISVTQERLRISVLTLLDRPDPAEQSATAQQLLRIAEKNGNKLPPSVHPVKDLQIKDLDFVSKFQQHESLQQQLLYFRPGSTVADFITQIFSMRQLPGP